MSSSKKEHDASDHSGLYVNASWLSKFLLVWPGKSCFSFLFVCSRLKITTHSFRMKLYFLQLGVRHLRMRSTNQNCVFQVLYFWLFYITFHYSLT